MFFFSLPPSLPPAKLFLSFCFPSIESFLSLSLFRPIALSRMFHREPSRRRKRHVLLWNKNVATSNAITRAARAPERGCCARLDGPGVWRGISRARGVVGWIPGWMREAAEGWMGGRRELGDSARVESRGCGRVERTLERKRDREREEERECVWARVSKRAISLSLSPSCSLSLRMYLPFYT